MKGIITIAGLLLSLTSIAQDEELKKTEELFRDFVSAVEGDDKEAVAKMIDYPLRRNNPIPDIQNEDEFIKYYDYIIDDSFKEILISVVDDPEIDMIDRSGATGKVGFVNGKIWMIYGEYEQPITTINYSSAAEQLLAKNLDRSIRKLLPEKIANFERNVYMGMSEDHIVRIDELEDGYRYISWSAGVSCQDEPDLVLEGGEIIPQGSAGGVWYKFSNGNYTYYLKRIRMAETAEQAGEFLTVEKNGKEIGRWKLKNINNQLVYIGSN